MLRERLFYTAYIHEEFNIHEHLDNRIQFIIIKVLQNVLRYLFPGQSS